MNTKTEQENKLKIIKTEEEKSAVKKQKNRQTKKGMQMPCSSILEKVL
jgi:hypothetical protein